MANRALLLASEVPFIPRTYEPAEALAGANYSVPMFWLSLFCLEDLVQWPSTLAPERCYTALAGDVDACRARSGARISVWREMWHDQFGECADRWLRFLTGIHGDFIAVWTEALSDMTGDLQWADALESYISAMDEPHSAAFPAVLMQSHARLSASREFETINGSPLYQALAGYAWSK